MSNQICGSYIQMLKVKEEEEKEVSVTEHNNIFGIYLKKNVNIKWWIIVHNSFCKTQYYARGCT